jgi:hypothetical protein
MHELAGQLHAATSERGRKLVELLANSQVTDFEKLSALTELIQDPRQAVAPLFAFASAISRDIETRQALRLFAQDELSTAAWLHEVSGEIRSMQAAEPAPLPAQ